MLPCTAAATFSLTHVQEWVLLRPAQGLLSPRAERVMTLLVRMQEYDFMLMRQLSVSLHTFELLIVNEVLAWEELNICWGWRWRDAGRGQSRLWQGWSRLQQIHIDKGLRNEA